MKKQILLPLIIIVGFIATAFLSNSEDAWGFFGHRRINRMAVFTLPPDMMTFFKPNIEYITAHAVDPDKRRYATKHEAVRHYIDIDMYGKAPFNNLPRDWSEALMVWTDVLIIDSKGDTTIVFTEKPAKRAEGAGTEELWYPQGTLFNDAVNPIRHIDYKSFFIDKILSNYYEDEWTCDCDDFEDVVGQGFRDCKKIFIEDHLSHAGIVPYHLMHMKKRLTKAFVNNDVRNILRNSAEYGHYLGDAHVPLHTTENYNGQMTDQVGIHAFWESRIPELFADDTYDFFVGKAEYIDNPRDYFWDIVLESHSYLDSVLLIEKRISETFPQDQQYCYDERLGRTIRTECRAYAEEYQRQMNGLMETRMQDAIRAVGNVWYTCWVDAGSPDLKKLLLSEKERVAEAKEEEELDNKVNSGAIIGRPH